jgi:radical SAM superfamily enzyme
MAAGLGAPGALHEFVMTDLSELSSKEVVRLTTVAIPDASNKETVTVLATYIKCYDVKISTGGTTSLICS